jgi:hypothetical protein
LRDLAVMVVEAKGVLISNAPGLYSYRDTRIRIAYSKGRPQSLNVCRHGELELKVLSVLWIYGGDGVVVVHRTGSWEDSLRRLAKAG